MAEIPAAAASTGILYLEYFPPGASFVYSTPKSFSKSKIPKTIAVTRFPNDAIGSVSYTHLTLPTKA